MRKKLLFITTRLFWPTDEGHKVLLFNYCKGLNTFYHYDIYLYSFLEADQNSEKKEWPDFIRFVKTAVPVPTSRKVKNVLRYSLIGKDRWSFQSAMFISPENMKNIKEYICELKPDAVIVDMIRLSRYFNSLSDVKGKKVLFMEDALSKRYARQKQISNSKASIAGQYRKNLPPFINAAVNSSFIKKMILQGESRRLDKEEVFAAKKYDSVIYVNETETEEMNRKTGKGNSYTVTMGADCDYFGEAVETEKENNTLCYVGNMTVAANADAVRMIMDKIIPLIPSRPVIHFIGKCPDSLKREYADNPQCIFEGRVDDIRKSVKRTQIVLSPIAYGTGVKTKVIEGMAMSMPVITNSLGIEGLSVENGRELLVSDDYRELASMTEELLHSPERCKELGENGHIYALKNHTWERIFAVFEKVGL